MTGLPLGGIGGTALAVIVEPAIPPLVALSATLTEAEPTTSETAFARGVVDRRLSHRWGC